MKQEILIESADPQLALCVLKRFGYLVDLFSDLRAQHHLCQDEYQGDQRQVAQAATYLRFQSEIEAAARCR